MSEPTHCYVAFSKCGCITGARVDDADDETGKDVAGFITSGRRVERLPIVKVNEIGFGCKCPKDQPDLFEKGGA